MFGLDGRRLVPVVAVKTPDEEQTHQGKERQAERPIIAEEPPCPLDQPRTADRAGRPVDGYDQSFARAQGTYRPEGQEAVGALFRVVRARGARRSGIGG